MSKTITDITLQGSDIDGVDLTYSLFSTPQNGSFSIDGNILIYNANQDWNGVETFTYKANDGITDSNISTISITVNAVNDNPVVTVGETNTQSLYFEGDDSFTVFNDSELQSLTDFAISLWAKFDENDRWDGLVGKGYLENKTGLIIRKADDNNKIRISQSDPSNNFVNILDSNNPILADSGWNHILVQRKGNIWQIYINGVNEGSIDFVNSAPQSFNSNADFIFAGNIDSEYIKGYLDDIALYRTTLTEDEISSFSENGNWKSAALINASNLMFYYQLNGDVLDSTSNNRNASNNGAVYSNEIPGTTSPTDIATDEDVFVDIDLSEYVIDVDGDDLTFSVVSQPSHGSINFISNSVLRYQPESDYNGSDTFTWKANDGIVDSDIAIINLKVNPVNDAPVSSNISVSTNKDNSVNITLQATDVENESLTFTLVSDASNGTTSLNNNVISYTPSTGYTGEDSFTFKANDGTIDSNISTVSITVLAPFVRYYSAKSDIIGADQSNYVRNDEWRTMVQETSDGNLILLTMVRKHQNPNSYYPYLMKVDYSDGSIIWEKIVNLGSGYTAFQSNSIREASDGGFLITGVRSSSDPDGLIVRLDDSGEVIWHTYQDSPSGGWEGLYSSYLNEDDNIWVTGGRGTNNSITGQNRDDLWTVTITDDGNRQLDKKFGYGSIETGSDNS